MSKSKSSTGLELSALDGSNPLGFLAALGTLVTLRKAGEHEARLGWRRTVKWTPYLAGLSTEDPEAVCRKLAEALRGNPVSENAENVRKAAQKSWNDAKTNKKKSVEQLKKKGLRGKEYREAKMAAISPLEEVISLKRTEYRVAKKAATLSPELAIGGKIDCSEDEFLEDVDGFLSEASGENRETLDFMADFGSNACLKYDGKIMPSPFDFSAGQKRFLDTVSELIRKVSVERVRAAVFTPWKYEDPRLGLRWDPIEDRRYARMDRDPTAGNNETSTVWMANLLAYRALPLFPSVPSKYGLGTVGWSRGKDAEFFTWPIWMPAIGADAILALLSMRGLTTEHVLWAELKARRVEAVFRTRKFRNGDYPNFSPARSL